MKSVRALIVEDSRNDTDLIVLELERNDFDVSFERVETAESMRSALNSTNWDLILCDNAMPRFNAISALQILKETGLDIPFIIVSGEIGEDLAVFCMKAGAHDFIMKGKLARLAPAVRREIKEANLRRIHEAARRKAEYERTQLLIAEQAARANAERLYKEASHANQLKDEFLATVSHELRTPLNAILGWADLLRNHEIGPESFDQALDVIHRNANAQAILINDLLDISRIISGKMELRRGQVDLSSIVTSVIESFEVAAHAKNLAINIVSDKSMNSVYGDKDRLKQVVWNLLSNAVKYTPNGGRIDLTLRADKSRIELSIEDTGEGITSEFLPFVFERFRQENSSPTRTHGGLGIGLGLVREIIATHGGEVDAFSRGKGLGSRFTIRIPTLPLTRIRDISGAPKTKEKDLAIEFPDGTKPNHHILEGISVLLIEDSDDSRMLVKLVLEQFGAAVVAIESAKKALEILISSKPDVVLCDISMPEMDGYEFIRTLRSTESQLGSHIPAAAFTAYVGVEDRKRAIASGFEEHIPKPVATHQLVSIVAKLCQRVVNG